MPRVKAPGCSHSSRVWKVDGFSLEKTRASVQINCHIADALHGSSYGLCTYLLKMREYFRWEQGLEFTDRLDGDLVGEWLHQREQFWSELEGREFGTVRVGGHEYDPFDNDAVNGALNRYGLAYSGGIGHSGRPHFFLAELCRREEEEEYSLIVTGRELARDLTAPPAMTSGAVIFVRRESLRRTLWEKLEGWRWSRPDNPLGRAFSSYPFDDDLEVALEQMTDRELDLVRLHEQGEYRAGTLLGETWNEMLLNVLQTPAELVARGVRDHLADCLVALERLAEMDQPESVHFYMGNLSAMRKTLFPALSEAYQRWLETGDGRVLSELAQRGAEHWQQVADEIISLYKSRGAEAATGIGALAKSRRM